MAGVKQILLPQALVELGLDMDDNLLRPVNVPTSLDAVYRASRVRKTIELRSGVFANQSELLCHDQLLY
jgi:hypothetical protein